MLLNPPTAPELAPQRLGLGPDVISTDGSDSAYYGGWGGSLTAAHSSHQNKPLRSDGVNQGDLSTRESPPLSGPVFHLRVRDTLTAKGKQAKDQGRQGTGEGVAGQAGGPQVSVRPQRPVLPTGLQQQPSRDMLQAERYFPTSFWSARFNTHAGEVNMDERQGQPLGLAGAGGPARALTGGRSLAWVRQPCGRREGGRREVLGLMPMPCQSPPLSGLNSRADMAALTPEGFLCRCPGPHSQRATLG